MSEQRTPESTAHDGRAGGVSRRGVLVGGAAAALLAACSSSSKSNTATSPTAPASSASSVETTTTTAASGGATGDAKVAMLAASLEVLAVGTYTAALGAATAGKLGTVPPAVATFVQTAMSHHQAALDKWNSVLTGAGAQAVSQPPADLKATVDKAFGGVTDVVGAARLALMLETIAADTYLNALPTLQSKDAITLAGALQIVDQEHGAILHYVLGEYPVPDVFQKTDMAYKGSS